MQDSFKQFPLLSNLDKSLASILEEGESHASQWKPKLFFAGEVYDIVDWKDSLRKMIPKKEKNIPTDCHTFVLQKNINIPMLQVRYCDTTQVLDWKHYQYAPLSDLLKELEKKFSLHRSMMLLRVGPNRAISLDRPDQAIDWTLFGFPPYLIQLSMTRPRDQECSICLETVSGLDYGSFDSLNKRKVVSCVTCWKMIHGAVQMA